jgi:hypothetical protein
MKDLMEVMTKDNISTPEKTNALKEALIEFYQDDKYYKKVKTMGQLVKAHLKHTLQKNLLLVPRFKKTNPK